MQPYVLAHYQTESATTNPKLATQAPLLPNSTLDNSVNPGDENVHSSPTRENALSSLNTASSQSPTGASTSLDPTGDISGETTADLIASKPSNLLVTFLEYCSIVMQVSKMIKISAYAYRNLNIFIVGYDYVNYKLF